MLKSIVLFFFFFFFFFFLSRLCSWCRPFWNFLPSGHSCWLKRSVVRACTVPWPSKTGVQTSRCEDNKSGFSFSSLFLSCASSSFLFYCFTPGLWTRRHLILVIHIGSENSFKRRKKNETDGINNFLKVKIQNGKFRTQNQAVMVCFLFFFFRVCSDQRRFKRKFHNLFWLFSCP